MTAAPNSSFLVIRRDNIGDLVCTTPLFEALRGRFPDARIYALVNSYNLSVLRGNPFIDEAFAYTKAKHREPGQSAWHVYADRLRLIVHLRRLRIDCAIIGGSDARRALSFARLLKPRRIVAHGAEITVPQAPHEVEKTFALLSSLGIETSPPVPKVYPLPDSLERAVAARGVGAAVGIHISSRKPVNRWPVDKFAELIRRLHVAHGGSFMLFWSPGDELDPRHPGDDRKAAQIIAQLPGMPVVPYPTHSLEDLIAALSVCERVICSDGGAMHIAAALGKPIVCFFGDTDAARWHPWGVPHVVLQPASGKAADITVDEAYAAFERLARASSAPSTMPA